MSCARHSEIVKNNKTYNNNKHILSHVLVVLVFLLFFLLIIQFSQNKETKISIKMFFIY